MSPTQRSLKYLRGMGYQCAVVEKFNSSVKIRQDCMGFGDILACHPNGFIALVQTTSGSNLAARRAKILADPRAHVWKSAGGMIYLHAWRKVGSRGGVKRWRVAEERL
jgi:hypothetical protein